jgi:hypothetical protein
MKARDLFVFEFVHEHADTLPSERRCKIYRAFARQFLDPVLAGHFFRCADVLEEAERNCRQLTLDLREGKGNGS